MSTVVLFNKPFDVLCQFTDGDGRRTLADWIDIPGIYPAGRLDRDSEGLLLLTDDGSLIATMADPRHRTGKTYWVQVEGIPPETALLQLRDGVRLRDGTTRPARVRRLGTPPALWEREPPIRQRNNDITSWLEIVLFEGRNRQLRRMTAAVGHPTLRLVRVAIGDWQLDGLAPGEYRVIHRDPASLPAKKPSVPRGKDRKPAVRPSGKLPQRPSRTSRTGRESSANR